MRISADLYLLIVFDAGEVEGYLLGCLRAIDVSSIDTVIDSNNDRHWNRSNISAVSVLISSVLYSYDIVVTSEINVAAEEDLRGIDASSIDLVFHPMNNYH